jgi:hypothetical protein
VDQGRVKEKLDDRGTKERVDYRNNAKKGTNIRGDKGQNKRVEKGVKDGGRAKEKKGSR